MKSTIINKLPPVTGHLQAGARAHTPLPASSIAVIVIVDVGRRRRRFISYLDPLSNVRGRQSGRRAAARDIMKLRNSLKLRRIGTASDIRVTRP